MQHRKCHQAAWTAVVVLWLGFAGALAAQQLKQPVADLDNLEGYKIAKPDVGPFDWPQWGGTSLRNNTPHGRNAPVDWDVPTETQPARNIKWSAKVGSTAYSSPVVANGRIFIGTNNATGYIQRFPWNDKRQVDLGVLLCFDERTGRFLWQHSNRKLPAGRVHDWPTQGVVSVPLVDGERLWYVSNRGEVVCLDTDGFADGENDGLFRDEEAVAADEADVVWKFDMMARLGTRQHNMCTCSLTSAGGVLFVVTGNGVDATHVNMSAPHAPAFLALDRNTAEVLWTDNSPGENVLHGQWSSPSYAVLGGRPQVIVGGGDGWLYSFDPQGDGRGGSKLLWKFDCNPKESKWVLGGRGTRCGFITLPVIYDRKVYVAVGQDVEHGDGAGRLWCIDPTKMLDGSDVSPTLAFDAKGNRLPHRRRQAVDREAGETARPNPNSAAVWCYEETDLDGDGKVEFEEEMHRSCGNAAVKDDLLYIADFSGLVHCVDARTGRPHWTHDMFAAAWAACPLIVDGKVYVGSEDGDVWIFRHSRQKEVLNQVTMDNAICSTPVFANDTLYIATRSKLYAIAADTDAAGGADSEK